MRIGLISDTHGLLRPEAEAALAGVDHILHAGDIGGPDILQRLEAIAPVSAVRGNNDAGGWARALPGTRIVELDGVPLYLLHDVKELDIDPGERHIAAVIAGHSHRPSVTDEAGVLFINPGSAGPRRFRLPVSVGFLELVNGACRAEIRLLME